MLVLSADANTSYDGLRAVLVFCLDERAKTRDACLVEAKDHPPVGMNEGLDIIRHSIGLPRKRQGEGRAKLPGALQNALVLVVN